MVRRRTFPCHAHQEAIIVLHPQLKPRDLNVLVIGAGGREHMLASKLAASPRVGRVYCAPGNAGTAQIGTNVPIDALDFDRLLAFARDAGIDLTVVGPADPTMAGIADRFRDAGLTIVGPTEAQARLEGSKAFSKAFMRRHGIPTARSEDFTDAAAALAHLDTAWGPDGLVIKMDGLAEVQSTLVTTDRAAAEALVREALEQRRYGEAGARLLIEERLIGPELSILAFIDGTACKPLPPAQDHKQLFDGGRGVNTEGMGAFVPVPIVDDALMARLQREVLEPTCRGMAEEGLSYPGLIFIGVLLTQEGPKVLEYNCRFGDPETQATLPGLETDLVEVFEACLAGRLDALDVRHDGLPRVCLVAADRAYPDGFAAGSPVDGLEAAAAVPGVEVIHALTAESPDGPRSRGGRVLNVIGKGRDVTAARAAAYEAIGHVRLAGEAPHFRGDVGLGGVAAEVAAVR
jgi:phosphoribosylamine--glycine ligase